MSLSNIKILISDKMKRNRLVLDLHFLFNQII